VHNQKLERSSTDSIWSHFSSFEMEWAGCRQSN